MAQTVFRSRRAYRATFVALCASTAFLPGVAFAQCTGTTSIACTGSSPSYSNTGSSTPYVTSVSVASGATVTGPLVINTVSNTAATLNNSGTIAGSLVGPTVLFGSNATINNGGPTVTTAVITASSASSGASAITVGNNSTVNNYGTLTATAGTPAVQFGSNGTFTNFAVAPVAISGNIVFGSSTGANVSTFTNNNTAYGLTGNVTSIGNTNINNNGLWTGGFGETPGVSASTVNFTNGVNVPLPNTDTTTNTGAIFTGQIVTGDVTTLINNQNASIILTANSTIGQSSSGSLFTNYGTLTVGSGTTPALLTVDGSFNQGANGTLNMFLLPPGSTGATPGTTFSQINAVSGSMNLGGTLALNVAPGFYPSGSTYNVLVADNGITGNFSSITGTSGASLPFLNFVPTGGVLGTNYQQSSETITTTITTTAASGSTAATTTTTTATNVPGATIGTTTTTTGSVTKTVTTVATGVITPGSFSGSVFTPGTNSIGIVTVSGTQQAYYQFTVTRIQTYYQALVAAGVGSPVSAVSTNELAIAKGLQPTLNGGIVADATTAVNANQSTNDVVTFAGQIDVLTIAQAQQFLDSVSPEGYLAYRTALHDQANAFTRSVALRMDDQNSEHDEDGWWFNTQGEYEIASNADTTKGYRTRDNLIGFVGGYDFSGPHHVYGLAMNLSWEALSYAPGTLNGHNRDLAFDAYGAYDLGPLKLSGQLAYNLGHLGANKTIDLGAVTRSAHGSAGEHLLKATGSVSLNVEVAAYKLTPFVSIEYANGKVNGFTETSAAGTTASDLTVSAMNANRTDVLAGFSFTRSVGMFRPYIRAAYRNQVGAGDSNTISAYFNGDTATGFNVTGVGEARHELDTNAGVNWVFDDAGTLFVGYQGTMRSGHTSVGLNFGVRLEF